MRILIIRHAEPASPADDLTEKGVREAGLLAERLSAENIDRVYCSPLVRARKTAAPYLAGTGKTAETLDWLKEFAWPVTYDDGRTNVIPWDMMPAQWTLHPENFSLEHWRESAVNRSGRIGEHYDDVIRQFDAFLAEQGYRRTGQRYEAVRPNTDTIALFCHMGLECVLLSRLLNISPVLLWQGSAALPSSVTTLYTEEREKGTAYFRMTGFGDVSHLTQAGEKPSFHARFCETYDNWEQRH